MDQFDKVLKRIAKPATKTKGATIVILDVSVNTTEAIRATLEVDGHSVLCAKSIQEYEGFACNETCDVVFIATDSTTLSTELLFETVSLIDPNTMIVGYSSKPNHKEIVKFFREGGSDFFCIPDDYNCIADRINALCIEKQESDSIKNSADHALQLCNKMNEERHRVEEENNTLNDQLANAHCDAQEKMKQVAIGAEFQTLVSQELDVESMLRTALGYMLTRIGATNAAVYLREGDVDWGIGAYINYDRQAEQFQSLIDSMAPVVCPVISNEEQIKHVKNGETFANAAGLDPVDFTGNEVVSIGCFSEDRCMAVIVLFRDESRMFTEETLATLETIRSIFGQQLGTILKIHRRAETEWPSETYDDDDWSVDKAA